MRKNELSNKIAKLRIKHLLKEGYTKAELSRNIGLAYKTIENILDPKKELIRFNTHEKIAQFCDNLEEQKTNEQTTDSYFLTSEDIIDSKAAEEEAKELEKFLAITFAILGILLVGFIFLIKYIIGLIN
jgi:DNA-binding Xre family transcriptional regulator/nitrate reductase NapE component